MEISIYLGLGATPREKFEKPQNLSIKVKTAQKIRIILGEKTLMRGISLIIGLNALGIPLANSTQADITVSELSDLKIRQLNIFITFFHCFPNILLKHFSFLSVQ